MQYASLMLSESYIDVLILPVSSWPLGFLQTGETVVPFGRFPFGMFIVLVAWFPTGRSRVFSLGLPVYWENT